MALSLLEFKLSFMYGVKRSIHVLCVFSFVSSSIVSGGIIVFLSFILYDVTGAGLY